VEGQIASMGSFGHFFFIQVKDGPAPVPSPRGLFFMGAFSGGMTVCDVA